MKPFSEVNQARVAKSQGRGERVFRSSLLAPRMPGAKTQIAFLNHFLLKRGIEAVSCKVTAIDKRGGKSGSYCFQVVEPILYTVFLEDIFGDADDIAQYMVEFYSKDDLAVPYPAVMINHWGSDFMNCVHAFNRVVNDVFEDDSVNKVSVAEASVDVVCDAPYSTFFNAVSGPISPGGTIDLSCADGRALCTRKFEMAPVRLRGNMGVLAEIFPPESLTTSSVFKVRQPPQKMFYGRLLTGVLNQDTGAFSANHSYYDTSEVLEYFENAVSQRCYPYFKGLSNAAILYPIMSPGAYEARIRLLDGLRTYRSEGRRLTSPDGAPVALSVDDAVAQSGFEDCTAFQIEVEALDGGRIPMRVMHQLLYGDAAGRSRLNSSIAVGLLNAKAFSPQDRSSVCWGQVAHHPDYHARTGLVFGSLDGDPADVEVEIYSSAGLVRRWTQTLAPGRALIVSDEALDFPYEDAGVLWFMARSQRHDLSAQSVHIHRRSGNASGEHSF